MKTKLIKILSLLMAVTVVICTGVVSATPVNAAQSAEEIKQEIDKLKQEAADLQNEINGYKNDINSQKKKKTAIENKMAVVQKQIDACNSQIASINKQIDNNKAEIEKNNKQIEKDKETFKRRLRAIQMSNTGSNLQILLGAKSFSEFLQLSQLTASVSARDKKLMEDIVAEIEKLNKKIEDNNKLLEEQSAVKAEISQKQAELKADADAIQKIINSIDADRKDAQDDKNAVDRELAEMEADLNQILYGGSGFSGSNDGKFIWPTTTRRISSYFGYRWNRNHNGVDISSGQYGLPIYAIADGTVYTCVTSCKHNYGKKPLKTCCGSGYGNYVSINHGNYKGDPNVQIKAYYAHLGSVTVKNGATVKKGQIIGYMGSTGRSTGPHLHFGMIRSTKNANGKWTDTWKDPMSFY